ncbi:MAG: dihydropteroate synthase [Candidatus Hydrogenedentota bacterium]
MFKTQNKIFPTDNNQFYLIGILNRTTDSFYDGGKYYELDDAIRRIKEMIDEGADIIDIGGESTRPGSKPLSVDKEIDKTVPLIKKVKELFPEVCISIDTYKSEVAELAISEGAEIVNDISGTMMDARIIDVVIKNNASIVINHIQGTPQTMQINPLYKDVILEVKNFLINKAKELTDRGLEKEKILLDVGIGFGKTLEHNLELLRNIDEFSKQGYEMLIGTSRKSFIGKIFDSSPKQRLPGTIASNVYAYTKGVRFFRIHDIKENKQALSVVRRII